VRASSLLAILAQVERGELTPGAASERLKSLPFEDLGDARVDHHRSLRTGLPEVIYAAGKTPAQTLAIFNSLVASGVDVLATRVDPACADLVCAQHPGAVYNVTARTLSLRQTRVDAQRHGHVAILCAGTSDLPVAEEAASTADTFGCRVTRLYDVGVAGLHRLLAGACRHRVRGYGRRAAVRRGWPGRRTSHRCAHVGWLRSLVCRCDGTAGNAEFLQPQRDGGQYR
jgi:NCAIR mutase (PurE)-related protein